ncbi:MAG: glycoside hydrolase family 28 protein [Christensenellaceae bacterium]|nr:glycoside hydrolase family 28 protein [Christensenellaceae bacterium]
MTIHNICSYGAIGNGSVSTKAIQAAIDACVPGDAVLIPKGEFMSGALFLKSDMELILEKDSFLIGSEDIADYPIYNYRFEGRQEDCYASLINGQGDNITIRGEGTINASGTALFRKEMREGKASRGRVIMLEKGKNIRIEGVTLRHAPGWCLQVVYSENVTIENVKIHTKFNEKGVHYPDIYNGDGIDIDSTSHVIIRNCTIESGDDCIAIKSGRDVEGRKIGIPTKDVLIENCFFKSGFGVAIGSEMSGGVDGVLVRNCVFRNTFSIGTVKAPRPRGHAIRNIHFENCVHENHDIEFVSCKWFKGAINIDQSYGYDVFDPAEEMPVSEDTPLIENISFKNCSLSTMAGEAIYLCGLPEMPLRNIHLENIKASGKRGLFAHNVDGLTIKNLSLSSTEIPAIRMTNVKNLK